MPHIGDDLENLKVLGRSSILAKLLGEDDLSFNVEIEGESYEVAPEDLIEAQEKENRFIKTEKGYVEVSLDWLDEYQDLLRSFVVSKKWKTEKRRGCFGEYSNH